MPPLKTLLSLLLAPLIIGLLYLYAYRDDTPWAAPLKPARPRQQHVLAGYFINWGIYDRGYNVIDVPAEMLSHILYAFAKLDADGSVLLSDPWADKDIPLGNGVHGNLGQFARLKEQHPGLKVSLSVGGWGSGANFSAMASDHEKRSRFASTAQDLIHQYGLDGLDVDWEFPTNDDQGSHMVDLLKEVRTHLGDNAILSVAVSCGPDGYGHLDLAGMNQYVDLFYLMAYDFSGPWEPVAGHQAPLYPHINDAVQYYAGFVPRNKLVLGLPAYGRAFTNTNGLQSEFEGDATYDVRTLPRPSATEHYDRQMGASWSYDPASREFVSYDNPQVIQQKALYALNQGLAGCMFWELSGDAAPSATDPTHRSLMKTVYDTFFAIAVNKA
ncbi:glycoside hydrolase [Hesseltinella vesiculosa]|uniref:Glycoside hydrolase n=1 Tax=Hesseltinella vesiculosa TaxID=101127 RepID=A0A1X2GAY2_9FUNG|nr:glycoside hydrolase [Hesseltinella vesiculosa]